MKQTTTTLDLARMIADAVLAAGAAAKRNRDSMEDGPTQAVLATLRRTRHWFVRVDDEGVARSVPPQGRR